MRKVSEVRKVMKVKTVMKVTKPVTKLAVMIMTAMGVIAKATHHHRIAMEMAMNQRRKYPRSYHILPMTWTMMNSLKLDELKLGLLSSCVRVAERKHLTH